MTCRLCKDLGIITDDPLSPFASYLCGCEHGAAARHIQNRRALDAYRTSGSEPITSASHAAQWDEMESALDTVRLQHRHVCRSCDKALPSAAKCGERCERCEDELAALGKPAPTFDKLDRWVLGSLCGVAVFCVLLLIKTMVWG